MPLVVEDGTGLANADAYVSVAYVRGYLNDRGRGNCVPLGDTELEQHIRRSTDYIDVRWGPDAVAWPLTETQALAFPRADGIIHDALKRACAEYAVESVNGPLAPALSADGQVTEKKIGPFAKETEASGRQETWRRYPVADRLMSQLVVNRQGVVRA